MASMSAMSSIVSERETATRGGYMVMSLWARTAIKRNKPALPLELKKIMQINLSA